MARLSMKRFAKEIGLSVGTVSAALNGLPSVKTETAAYVRRKAVEYGYAPNPWARKMQDRASRLFAIVLPDRPTILNTTITQVLIDRLRREGYVATVYYISDATEIDLYRAPVDGFMLISSDFPKLRSELIVKKLPHLVIDPNNAKIKEYPECSTILLDRYRAARDAAHILYNAGSRYFIFFTEYIEDGPKNAGFQEGLDECGSKTALVTIDSTTAASRDGRLFQDIIRSRREPVTGTTPPGVWVASLRDMSALVRLCDQDGLIIGQDLYTLYWGSHFHELPGFEQFSYIGEADAAFFTAVLEWARDPQHSPRRIHRIRLQPEIRASIPLSKSRMS